MDPAELKACCAAVYESDLVALVLGPSYHPGGRDLTRRLARALDLRPGERVLDVASGPGTTAFLLAEEFGATVDGVDAGALTVERARTGAAQRHLADRVRFCCADAEALPFDDGAFDAVVCECAFCTFPDQEAAAAEFARVPAPRRPGRPHRRDRRRRAPRPGAAHPGRPRGLPGRRPPGGVTTRPSSPAPACGSCVTEAHDEALARMVDQIDARLRALGAIGLPGVDLAAAEPYLAAATRAVRIRDRRLPPAGGRQDVLTAPSDVLTRFRRGRPPSPSRHRPPALLVGRDRRSWIEISRRLLASDSLHR